MRLGGLKPGAEASRLLTALSWGPPVLKGSKVTAVKDVKDSAQRQGKKPAHGWRDQLVPWLFMHTALYMLLSQDPSPSWEWPIA